MSSQTFEASGVVLENLPNTTFRVKVTQSASPAAVESVVLCTLSGKMRIHWVRLLPGDQVRCEISSLDPTRGRVTYKLKN